MSQFSYDEYQKVVARAQAPAEKSTKVSYFKLAHDGDEALVRFNIKSLDDLKFASVHAPVFGQKFEGLGFGLTPVMCLNEIGSYSDNCPFCRAAAEGHPTIGKASKKVYVQMMVAYKDPSTGAFGTAIPVVWERPAGFSRELAAKIRDYGSLAEHVFKVTRIGLNKDTRYSLDYIPLYDKPETVSDDFSAFDGFDVDKHSFWVKTAEEMQSYIDTGSFQADDGISKNWQPKPTQNFSNGGGAAKAEEKPAVAPSAFGYQSASEVKPSFSPQQAAEQPAEVQKPEEKSVEAPKFKGFSF